MPHDPADYLADCGFLLIEGSYLPQLWRLYRMKEAHEFHVLYPCLNLMGRLLGFSAGILMHKQSITAGFALGILIRSILLAQVLYYRRREALNEKRRLESISL